MMFKNFWRKKAVTLTELLVVLAIVALLATMAVPVYINQLQRAKITTAQAETREITQAMNAVAVTHGFLVPIHVLDNIPNRNDGGAVTGTSSSLDDFENLSSANRFVINVNIPLDDQGAVSNTQLDLSGNTSDDERVQRMTEGWQGPFLNPKRVRYPGQTAQNPFAGDITEDIVVDPWGNPYRVYSQFGILGSESPSSDAFIDNVTVGHDNLEFSTTSETDRFDRFAVVSYGVNGESDFNGDPLDQGDDIFSTFVINPGNESRYQFY